MRPSVDSDVSAGRWRLGSPSPGSNHGRDPRHTTKRQRECSWDRIWAGFGVPAVQKRVGVGASLKTVVLCATSGEERGWRAIGHRETTEYACEIPRGTSRCARESPLARPRGQSPLRCGCCCCRRTATGTGGTPRRNARDENWAHVKPSSH